MPPVFCHSLEELFQHIDIHKHKHLSFHHHLRNGDFVMNTVLRHYRDEQVEGLHLHPSSIFPSYTMLLELLERGQIASVTTNYLNGPVAQWISEHGLPGELKMQTHGGRARSIIDGRDRIDVAYLAAPAVDAMGNAVGYLGQHRCGSLGYAVADSQHAGITVLVTDTVLSDPITDPEIQGVDVDYVVIVDAIGDPDGIVSGTTSITTHPIGVRIASLTVAALDAIGAIREGFSFQSGAGGVSLRVTDELSKIMRQRHITASFFSGGITGHHVAMLEAGLVDRLYDVQCFDLAAVDSLARNDRHIPISASRYANPADPDQVIADLDVVILGATEVDLDFNVNVTTDSHGVLIGGSGGHSDTASESQVTVIVSPLMRGRLPLIKDRVTTITTKGEHVDLIVTERGIAVHPERVDLKAKLEQTTLPVMTIETLQAIAHSYTGKPVDPPLGERIIGVVEDRTYEILDNIHQKK
mgnify:CR=1 FL=1